MGSDLNIAPQMFWQVASCKRCSTEDHPGLLRDALTNLPQPGYIGSNYREAKVLLVGKNPDRGFTDPSTEDRDYIEVLLAMRDRPSDQAYANFKSVSEIYMPKWEYVRAFPFGLSGLRLNDVAFINMVRCRSNRPDARDHHSPQVIKNCITAHFERWLNWLEPNVVISIGKGVHDRISNLLIERNILHRFIKRSKMSETEQRTEEREVSTFVRQTVGGSLWVTHSSWPLFPKETGIRKMNRTELRKFAQENKLQVDMPKKVKLSKLQTLVIEEWDRRFCQTA